MRFPESNGAIEKQLDRAEGIQLHGLGAERHPGDLKVPLHGRSAQMGKGGASGRAS